MNLRFETYPSVEAVDREVWNSLVGDASPMMEWEYFYALERSGSVSPERGYKASHIMAFSGNTPVALAPLYEREKAWVEFGDGGLLEFMTEITGVPFNRGILGSIPFTPVPGYQFLCSSRDGDEGMALEGLLSSINARCEMRGLLTSRIYFASPAAPQLHSLLRRSGYVTLRTPHSMWFNKEYESFDDYLGSFKSSRRTKIKRELRTLREGGIEVKMVPGTEASDMDFERMHRLYVRTWVKHMGIGVRPFLSKEFFSILSERFRHRTAFSIATRGGQTIAMAIFYLKHKSLYGRYWGCFEEVPFLHFDTCYYQPIDFAIRRGIAMMDPGFGGDHKVLRGYEVVPISHYIKFHGDEPRRIANSVIREMQGYMGDTGLL